MLFKKDDREATPGERSGELLSTSEKVIGKRAEHPPQYRSRRKWTINKATTAHMHLSDRYATSSSVRQECARAAHHKQTLAGQRRPRKFHM